MIAFFIFYFLFSVMFILGNESYKEDDISIKRLGALVLFGWLALPFGLGMLFAKIISGDLQIKKEENE